MRVIRPSMAVTGSCETAAPVLTVAPIAFESIVAPAAAKPERTRCDLGCALEATRHDRDEFFAAEASDDVVRARARPHHPAEQAQDLVASSMTKAIIDRLEVIEIEHQHRHRLVMLGLQRAQRARVCRLSSPVR